MTSETYVVYLYSVADGWREKSCMKGLEEAIKAITSVRLPGERYKIVRVREATVYYEDHEGVPQC